MRRIVFLTALLALRCAAPSKPVCDTGALGLETNGMTVSEVLPRGPADVAGIRRDDVIVSIGGREIRYACEVEPLAFHRDCKPVTVVVRRGNEQLPLNVTPVDQASLYEKACDENDPTACFRRAWLNSESCEDACDRGSAAACAEYGYRLMEQKNEAAVAVLERACDKGSGAGCTHLGYLYVTGTLVPKNEIRAMDFYTRGCSYGDARGCYNVGVMHDRGSGTTVSASRAVKAYEQACAAGVSMACTDAGWLYERGLGSMKDPVRAADLYRRGCEGSPCEAPNLRGCVNLGDAYRDGIGVAKDVSRAAEIFRDACERKADGDNEESARVRACVLLGAFEMDGLGVTRNVESGLARTVDGCTRGDAVGCFNAAGYYASHGEERRAAELYATSCDAKDAEACYELGVLYDEAKGVPFDGARSTELFRRACTLGFAPACERQ